MRKLSVREIRASLPQLERDAPELEGEVVITRNGEPIARLLPAVRKDGIPSHAEFRQPDAAAARRQRGSDPAGAG